MAFLWRRSKVSLPGLTLSEWILRILKPRNVCGQSARPPQAVRCFWCSPSGSATAGGTSGRSAPGTCIKRRLTTMKKKTPSKKRLPTFKTDEEAERFVDTADLTAYDLSGFKPMQFEFERKDARVNMRLPEQLLSTLKEHAKQRGIPYQRFI